MEEGVLSVIQVASTTVAIITLIWLAVLAAREGVGWCLAVLFVPLGALVFVIRYWHSAKGAFLFGTIAQLLLVGAGVAVVMAGGGPERPEMSDIEKRVRDLQHGNFRVSESPRTPTPSRPPRQVPPTRDARPPRDNAAPSQTPPTPEDAGQRRGGQEDAPEVRAAPRVPPPPSPDDPPAEPESEPAPTGPTLVWDLPGWEPDTKLGHEHPMVQACGQVKTCRLSGGRAWVGGTVGPVAEGRADAAYTQFKAEQRALLAQAVAKQGDDIYTRELTQTVGRVPYDRVLASRDGKLVTVLSTVRDGRCAAFWYVGPSSGWHAFADQVAAARVAEPATP